MDFELILVLLCMCDEEWIINLFSSVFSILVGDQSQINWKRKYLWFYEQLKFNDVCYRFSNISISTNFGYWLRFNWMIVSSKDDYLTE